MLGVVFDCDDPARLAGFWLGLIGGSIDTESAGPDWVAIKGVGGLGYVAFQRVPEPKSVKNRVHVDHHVDDLEHAVEESIALGATIRGDVVTEATNRYRVMLDPEGNEFCLVERIV